MGVLCCVRAQIPPSGYIMLLSLYVSFACVHYTPACVHTLLRIYVHAGLYLFALHVALACAIAQMLSSLLTLLSYNSNNFRFVFIALYIR